MKASDKLRVYWSRREQDFMAYAPLGFETRRDSRFLMGLFTPEALASLESRGYDTKTLKVSIEPKEGHVKFSSQRPVGMSSAEAWDTLNGLPW